MGLDIITSDDGMDFHISYLRFTNMRAFFILHYSEDAYYDYRFIIDSVLNPITEINVRYQRVFEKIGDLRILVDHSDCDGELTPDECGKLRPCLFVDEEKIHSVTANTEYANDTIELMYSFIELVEYSIDNDVKLIFA